MNTTRAMVVVVIVFLFSLFAHRATKRGSVVASVSSVQAQSGDPRTADTAVEILVSRRQPELLRRTTSAENLGEEVPNNGQPDRPTEGVPGETEALSLIQGWKQHLARLDVALGNREVATERLLHDIDMGYRDVVRREVDGWTSLSASEQADRLSQLQEEIEDGTAMLANELGLDGDFMKATLPSVADALAAETQYGDLNISHDQRVAMLRLDREREGRMANLFGAAGFGPESERLIQSELEPWYEAQLELVVGEPDAE